MLSQSKEKRVFAGTQPNSENNISPEIKNAKIISIAKKEIIKFCKILPNRQYFAKCLSNY